MGAYLSEPVTEKVSSDEYNDNLVCGASSMQGWRVNQEDAHNTILDYDENTSLFAVYDGHGGAEVAAYCAQKLPDFIKATEAYKTGDMNKALIDAFLGFDETIATKEVLAILKELAGDKKADEPDKENVKDLYQEACMPLEDLIAKYQEVKTPLSKLKATEDSSPLSPFLRARKSDLEDADGPSGSGEKLKVEDSTKEDADVSSSTNTSGNDKDANGDQQVSTSETENVGTTIEKTVTKEVALVPDSSDDNCEKPEQSQDAITAQSTAETTQTEQCNGEVTESKLELKENDISSSQNGETPPKIKSGKAKDKSSGISSTDAVNKSTDETVEKEPKLNIRRAAVLYNTMLDKMRREEDEDESDSNDETFQGEESSSSEETANGVSDSSNEADGDEEESSSEAEEEYPDDYTMNEEPGADSGCTAVVALLRGNQLYVANAGDSRCIVSREGKAIEMSIDHKPEDSPEWERIEKAGGKVTIDGRVNGGLNLSRAIGDHSYKQNKDLDAREQMITALPDIKTLTIDPTKDEFVVLACDGIWNFMSSQDVVDFITPRLAAAPERLSQICEEMFDHCLAPTNIGDGTGCDNMTAVIVKFKHKTTPSQEVPSTEGVSTTDCPKKRAADDEPSDSQDTKRQRVQDETLSSAVVTSSV